ncbi:MAG: methyltransferase domain-containing protein [Gemmatimonadaceae bacterium]|nr:methyltransferase domain-containing protein [Gemmatimonadaceae bacterium]
MNDDALRPELAALDRRFVLADQSVTLPKGPVRLLKPRNPDDLISEAEFAEDERLPYWADLWPSAIVLAEHLETHPAAPRAAGTRPRALELGCGLGLVTIAATRAGYEVLATDYYADATRFAARNALRNGVAEPATRMVDWRHFPDDLGTFDLVLAADVLYERPYAPLVAEAIRRTLAPGGRALVADQGRVALGAFLEEVQARRLAPRIVHHEVRPTVPAAPEGSAVHSITVYELRDVA